LIAFKEDINKSLEKAGANGFGNNSGFKFGNNKFMELSGEGANDGINKLDKNKLDNGGFTVLLLCGKMNGL
jgi:hypothetical protein